MAEGNNFLGGINCATTSGGTLLSLFERFSNLPEACIYEIKISFFQIVMRISYRLARLLHHISVRRIVWTRLKDESRYMHKRMKILIVYDRSRRSDDAIEDLQNAGLPREAEAKVISIVEPITPAGMPEVALNVVYAQFTEHLVRQAKTLVKEACERLSELFPGWDLGNAVYRGKTEQKIIELASEWKPDLVVICPLNRNEFERLIFGSLSRNIVEKSSCSVRVVRLTDARDSLWPRLLIGFDGSAGSAATIREIVSRCWPRGTQVRLVTGFKTNIVSSSEPDDSQEVLFRIRLEVAVRMLRAAGLVVSTVIREGSPRRVILDEAAKYGAHCIFLSGDDRSVFRRLIFSSTAAAVASKANCTVEVVREVERQTMTMESGTRWKVRGRSVVEAITQASAQGTS